MNNSQKTMKTLFSVSLLFLAVWVSGQTGFVQEGKASFYADKFEGRVTASGERYSHQKATCAHLSLPFGSLVKVTNLSNNLSVVVRVNDRGPFVANRIIDLSQSAAEKLGFLLQGVVDVRIELLDEKGELVLPPSTVTTNIPATKPTIPPSEIQSKPNIPVKVPDEKPLQTPPAQTPIKEQSAETGKQAESELFRVEIDKIPARGFTVQIGSYRELANVLRIAEDLKTSLRKDVMVQTSTLANGDKVYRLMAGHFSSRRDAETFREKARKLYPDCFIVELK